jgi:hypothetical protein
LVNFGPCPPGPRLDPRLGERVLIGQFLKIPIADKLSQNRVNFCKLEIFSVREIRLIVIIPPGT